jgi:archaellum component FlaG (FlaF/FlaG flagellin family)
MIRSLILMPLVALLLAGCASVKVVPELTGSGSVNAADNSQTIKSNGVEVSARADETAINSYNLDATVTAFHIAIKNTTDNEISFDDDSYLLVDESGLQYSLLTPEKVRTMLKKDSYYLIPYPYVGYYYLDDYEKTNAYNRMNSSLPYYYELYPQDLFTQSLQPITIIPGG